MSEEVIITEEPQPAGESREQLAKGFKSLSVKIGAAMIIMLVLRLVGSFVSGLVAPVLPEGTISYIVSTLISDIFVYAIPIPITYFILREPLKEAGARFYKKPVYFGKALGMFPAMYGVGITVNVITMAVMALISLATGGSGEVENPILSMQAINPLTAVIMFVNLAIVAPVCEEFWFRGLFMQSLRRYGNGVAIFISAVLFGLTHGNFQQFFYATAVGIVLGYVAVATESITTSTVLHAMLNSVAGIMMVFLASPSVAKAAEDMLTGTEPETSPALIGFAVYMCLVGLLLIVGVVMAIFKLFKIKRYKVPTVQTELSAGARWGLFFSRPAVVVMLVLVAAVFALQYIPLPN